MVVFKNLLALNSKGSDLIFFSITKFFKASQQYKVISFVTTVDKVSWLCNVGLWKIWIYYNSSIKLALITWNGFVNIFPNKIAQSLIYYSVNIFQCNPKNAVLDAYVITDRGLYRC